MRELHPEQYTARMQDKLNYRYPGVGGESYADLIMRVQESILALEQVRVRVRVWVRVRVRVSLSLSHPNLEQRRGNTVIVCDRAVARVLLGYFLGTQPDRLPFLEIFPGVVELQRTHSGFVATNLEVP